MCGKNIENLVKLHSGKEEYHLCSKQCKVDFLMSPEKFEKPWFYFRKHGVDSSSIICAICGEKVSEEVAVDHEYFDENHLKHFFFCNESHRIEFISNSKKSNKIPV